MEINLKNEPLEADDIIASLREVVFTLEEKCNKKSKKIKKLKNRIRELENIGFEILVHAQNIDIIAKELKVESKIEI